MPNSFSTPVERAHEMIDVAQFKVRGRTVPAELCGGLRESSLLDSDDVLQQRLEQDGYLFLRSALDQDKVLAAREEIFQRMVEVDEIAVPAVDGIATGRSCRADVADDLTAFWKSVSEGAAIRGLAHGKRTREVMDRIYGEPSRPQDYMWIRPRKPGWSTGLHYDHPFFVQNSDRVFTAWIPLGEIPLCDGPLMLVEGSNAFDDLISGMRAKDGDVEKSPEYAKEVAFFSEEWDRDPIEFAEERESRLLSEHFHVGDLLVFNMTALHGSLDNHSSIGRVRLSCDVRFQPASVPIDERYFGPNPSGQEGTGYASMNSCKPLTKQ